MKNTGCDSNSFVQITTGVQLEGLHKIDAGKIASILARYRKRVCESRMKKIFSGVGS